MAEKYDSRPDTRAHIAVVASLMETVAGNLAQRAFDHDRSKLTTPEVEAFDEYTPELREHEYGSPEYRAALAHMREPLEHHYAVNDHHPEHFPGGVHDMTLMQLTEMICDWIAAGRRHKPPTDIHKSIDMNAKRFGYDTALRRCLHLTADEILRLEAA